MVAAIMENNPNSNVFFITGHNNQDMVSKPIAQKGMNRKENVLKILKNKILFTLKEGNLTNCYLDRAEGHYFND